MKSPEPSMVRRRKPGNARRAAKSATLPSRVPSPTPSSLIRPSIAALHAYVPGEQPKIRGLIKLNTNENPYPPSPKVLRAIRDAVDDRLRLYPHPTSLPLREAIAKYHHCSPENVLIGNGSDDCLALLVRAFTEPRIDDGELPVSQRAPDSASLVQFLSPCYSLYPVLARIHGAQPWPVPLRPDFGIPSRKELAAGPLWRTDAALTFITTPNAPSGRGYTTKELEALCKLQKGAVVLDEAYADFAEENALDLALRHPNVLVTRTFSKAYSLCFQRVGYVVGHPSLIQALDKIRDSYNVNGLGQVAALASLGDLPYYRRGFERIKRGRARLSSALQQLGFLVLPSQANFILVRPPNRTAEEWLHLLRDRKILVRWFGTGGVSEFLRITIGSDREIACVIRAAHALCSST